MQKYDISHCHAAPGTHALCTQVAHVALAASLAFRNTPGVSLKQELALGPVQRWVVNDAVEGGPFSHQRIESFN